MTTPYMTQKHFEVLADELAQDKFFYDSLIAFHEKLDRMIKYCQDSNERFDVKKFTARIDLTYNAFDKKMRSQVQKVGA